MKKILFLLLIPFGLQGQTASIIGKAIRASESLQVGNNASQKITGIVTAIPGSPTNATLPTSKAISDYLNANVLFYGGASGGDLSGAWPTPRVAKIQDFPVSTTDPTEGQVFQLVSGVWTPTTISTGNTYTAGSGIAISGGNVISNTAPNVVQTLSIAGQDLTLSGGGGTVTIPNPGGTVTSVNLTQPAAGVTVSGGPVTGSGSIALALANDLAAVEGLSGTGLATRTGTDTWTNRSIAQGNGITVSNGDGVSGNPTIANNISNATNGLQVAANGALSLPAMQGIGTWVTGGTATTNKPYALIEPTGATSGAWSTAGTGFAVNAPSGFTGNIVDFQLNGSARLSLSSAGALAIASNLQVGASSAILWSGRSTIQSTANGTVLLSNAAVSGFDRLMFGLTTSAAPAIKRNGATMEDRLADDSGFAARQSLYDRFGSGSPEGVVAAPVGAVYHNTTGGTGTAVYHKETGGTGNTGWVAK